MRRFDVIVIGGGQSGLAAGYYLRRTGLSYTILDNQSEGGGSWQHYWKSLKLFSPAQWSSLPGVVLPGGGNYYPSRDEAVNYLRFYEEKYQLPVKRNVHVRGVTKSGDLFRIDTSDGNYEAQTVVSATGSFSNWYIPQFDGAELFQGEILHSNEYSSPDRFKGKRVAIVGEGNSGAQILAEVSTVADTFWITQKEPRFLPDHVDGRFLFDAATQMYEAQKMGKQYKPPSLGDIVMVGSVKDARSRNVLKSRRPFARLSSDAMIWPNGDEEKIDVIIFCTGFKPALQHLQPLNLINEEGKADTVGTRSKQVEGLWFVGYGNWTGFASATLIGVGRSAKATVDEITKYISVKKNLPINAL